MLKFVKFSHRDKRHRTFNEYICSCGHTKILQQALVNSGNTRSCGCLRKIGQTRRLPDNRSTINAIILGYKRHAKDRGIDWLLSYDEVVSLIFKDCFYCGVVPSNRKVTKADQLGILYSGIDRKNNKLGYTIDNCVPACAQCNYSKRTLSLAEYSLWIKRLAANMEQWG